MIKNLIADLIEVGIILNEKYGGFCMFINDKVEFSELCQHVLNDVLDALRTSEHATITDYMNDEDSMVIEMINKFMRGGKCN